MTFWTDVGFSECNLIPFLEDFFHAQIGIYISVLRSFKKNSYSGPLKCRLSLKIVNCEQKPFCSVAGAANSIPQMKIISLL